MRPGTRLFLIYALASLVPVVLLGLLLTSGAYHEARDRALAQGAAQAAVIEEMAVAPRLRGVDLRKPLGRRARFRLLDATQLAIFSGSVTHLHVRAFDGAVAFTDDGDHDDVLPASHPAFRAAARGGRRALLSRIPDGDQRVVRVLQPIVPAADGQATGVLEVQLPYAPIAAEVDANLHATLLRIGGALALLYVLLAGISWSTTRGLRRHAAERHHRSLHDPLTGLPNRELFRDRAERAIAARDPGAIALMDLDRFKGVNDTLGHHAGDELLQEVARRLAGTLRTDDVAARLGGDEFGLVLPRLPEESAQDVLERIGREVAQPVVIDGVTVDVEASFGVALFPRHGADLDVLLKRADAAMYDGKRGTGRIVVSHGADPVRDTGTVGLQSALRHAIAAGELELHYQPKVELSTGRTHSVEALLRWRHPERGLLGPGAFLPAAEQSSLIEPLTAWVLERALEDRAGWTAAGADWPVSVNVSARNLGAAGFADRVLALLQRKGTPPEALCIEITETAMAADADIATAALVALGAAGVAVSIDDFGKGYTSLSQLRTLPVTEIKVDRTFVGGLPGGAEDRSIVGALVELGRGLGCAVTAEGVETEEVAAWLAAAGCDTAQGYHFARPAPWPELLARFTDPVPVPA